MANDKPTDDKQQAIVDARLRLMQRFHDKMARSPGVADDTPQGTGPVNRHGMPAIPVGQTQTTKWPVLDLGHQPGVTRDTFKLVVDGAVHRPFTLDWPDLMALPQVDDVSDFHCVTTWSRLDLHWQGVRLSTLLSMAVPHDDATHLLAHGSDSYTTNVPLEEALKDDVLVVHSVDGELLPDVHGGPVRMITPQLYAWKGSKWLCRLEVLVGDKPGFWEERGYSMSAHPWKNDRYR
ncbi:MAG: molybdopterin-dependent oxidoreductase [Deltaproteobacteria bacterium]|nr:molybdopterin-dependent oxidoreductase [Deltaproteobacteria bacterium]